MVRCIAASHAAHKVRRTYRDDHEIEQEDEDSALQALEAGHLQVLPDDVRRLRRITYPESMPLPAMQRRHFSLAA